MINIGLRMKKAIDIIRNGAGDVEAPDVRAEMEEDWTRDWAIICDFFPDPMVEAETSYFDRDRWEADMREVIVRLFTHGKEETRWVSRSTKIKVTEATPKKRVHETWVKPGTIIVHMCGRDELEVYRAKLPEKKAKKRRATR